MKATLCIAAVLAIAGCAARPPHAMITKAPTVDCTPELIKGGTPCLGPVQYVGDSTWQDGAEAVRPIVPSQLTPVGCFLHEVIFWHKPLECRKAKKAK